MDGSTVAAYQLVAINAAGEEVQRVEVQALPLRPQDVLVVRPPEGWIWDQDETRVLRERIEALCPGQRVLVFAEHVELLRLELAQPAPPSLPYAEVVVTPGTVVPQSVPLDGLTGTR